MPFLQLTNDQCRTHIFFHNFSTFKLTKCLVTEPRRQFLMTARLKQQSSVSTDARDLTSETQIVIKTGMRVSGFV